MLVREVVAWYSPAGRAADGEALSPGWAEWSEGPVTLRWRPRGAAGSDRESSAPSALVVGDEADWDAAAADANIAGGAVLRWDAATRTIVALTSIVGLPPLYRYRRNGVVAIASSIALLRDTLRVALSLDAAGVTALGRFGHPVDGRTLFREVELLPAGSRVTIGAGGGTETHSSWALPEADPLDQASLVELQMEAFRAAVTREQLEGCFLSLTAGLDTRAVLSVLADQDRLMPAVTMTGRRLSLDARIARRLSRAYGFEHRLVHFDAEFTRELPRLVRITSRLSGGLSSLGQAPEVHLYESLGGAFDARLSGNLGNQVGRGGTEGVSLRNASLDILAPPLRDVEVATGQHWLLHRLAGDARSRVAFILSGEIPYSSVANYSVGQHFATQRTPYASRALIETLSRRPLATESGPSGSALRMRLRDLRHRFLGEPASVSFQRSLVARIGGPASQTPINWGWRPTGGVSPLGTLLGVAAMTGMLARAKSLDDGPLRGVLRATGLPALHDFHETRRWLRHDLREFVRDTLAAAAVRQGGVLERQPLETILDEHFAARRDHYKTVSFALDLALAQQAFTTSAAD